MNNVIYILISCFDLLTLEVLGQSEQEVGFYAACFAITGFMWVIISCAYKGVIPYIHMMLVDKEHKQLQYLMDKATATSLMIVGLMFAVIVVYPQDLLSHFGPSYTSASNVLIILTLSTFLGALSQPTILLLVFGGEELFILKVKSQALVTFVFLCPFLTYCYGIKGTALSNLIIASVLFFAQLFRVKKKLALNSLIIF